jgi:CRP-like cAMP-binding protein
MNVHLFKESIQSVVPIDDAGIEHILSCFKQVKINKGGALIKENTFVNQYYFLEKGLLRLVYHTKSGEETSWVIFEGSLFTEMISLKSKQRSNMRIEALEPAIVFCIEKTRLDKLCEEVNGFERFLRLTWEENLYRLIEMKLLQQFSSAKERYDTLMQNGELMQRIPQKYLASILGITPYSLSRLRKQRKT